MTNDDVTRHTVTVTDGTARLIHSHRHACPYTAAFTSVSARRLCASLPDGAYAATLTVSLQLHLREMVIA